ncbi:TniQ family protein [Pseudomonas abietaniphila]
MLLRIQRDETIRSYIERSTFLSEQHLFKKNDAADELTISDFREVASMLGWHGCYGFNQLLHNHTIQPLLSVFKNPQDMAYSGSTYICQSAEYGIGFEPNPKFCPECVKADISSLGYSYWRRTAISGLTVCRVHNVLLEANCPICSKRFDAPGHGLDVMWKGCKGEYLQGCASRPNLGSSALRRSVLFEDICNYRYHVPLLSALETLSLKLCSATVKKQTNASQAKMSEVLYKIINGQLTRFTKLSSDNVGFYFESVDFDAMFNALALLYDDFEEFIRDLVRSEEGMRDITSLWSTFRAGGHESAFYIREDYTSGVGEWYCPFPSSRSAEFGSGDHVRKLIPILYPCCGIDYPKEAGVERSPMWVDPPNPAVPCVGS